MKAYHQFKSCLSESFVKDVVNNSTEDYERAFLQDKLNEFIKDNNITDYSELLITKAGFVAGVASVCFLNSIFSNKDSK